MRSLRERPMLRHMNFASTPADIRALDARLDGSAVAPGDERWDAARQAWNLAVDQRPAVVVTARSVADVQAAVIYARDRGLRVAPQSTGHNAAALGSLDNTLLLKLQELKRVDVDTDRRRFRAEAGTVWLDVTSRLSGTGLVPPLGSSPDVGVAGFTLGGGFCWVGRKYGLASNNVTAIEVVLADGSHVTATAKHRRDLFWALRGGGGNFGVVTAIEMKLFSEPEIYATTMLFPSDRGAEVLHAWREYIDAIDENTTTYVRYLNVPPLPDIPEPIRGGSFINVEVVHLGSEEAGRAVSEPIRALGGAMEMGGMMDAEGLNHFHMDPEEPVPAIGGAHVMLDDLSPEAVDAIVSVGGPEAQHPLLMLELRHIGGALDRVPENAGARRRLPGKIVTYAAGMVMDAETAVAIESHLEKVELALRPYDSGHRYLNFVEHKESTESMYEGDDHARLASIRAQYDPAQLFQANHEIYAAQPLQQAA
jgi:FAD binding domain/Berberine and berberine like